MLQMNGPQGQSEQLGTKAEQTASATQKPEMAFEVQGARWEWATPGERVMEILRKQDAGACADRAVNAARKTRVRKYGITFPVGWAYS